MKKLTLIALAAILAGCNNDPEQTNDVDTIYTNATIYTVDNEFSTATAMAVKDGKIYAIGNEELDSLSANEKVDLKGQFVYPGLIDAHCHFYRLGQQTRRVDLTGTKSYQEVLNRIAEFHDRTGVDFIIGRGWDQNDWENKEFPNNYEISLIYPDIPVALTRIDGHAMIVNDAALKLAGIDENTVVEGGDIEKKDGKLTGILVDNPMDMVTAVYPEETREDQINALLAAQKENFKYGITTVDDAGLDRNVIELIDSLQQAGDLKMKVYAMISNTPENLDHYLDEKGIVKTDRLNVRSVKFYGDGALGSRGAAMREPYSDRDNHYGALLSSPETFKETAERIARSDYQMNTHAIGDSANTVVLKTYRELLNDMPDRRWRVEHAQIVTPEDFEYFDSDRILPSVQPTHATSDMYWAEDRIGEERMQGAYAFKKLMEQSGMVALGTDYPVEQVNPFLTFYASTARKDTSGFPEDGFMADQALSREETLKGMTIWAAYSNFEEDEKGSLEKGKAADFMILDKDLITMPIDEVPNLKVKATYINGEQVYQPTSS
ncbi:amidohydrolase [Nonlabens ponticola]|uniref:Amidohydrolase n=1 Tax=Nonlabens ponticola TaxID=2496866 RepID=A0A3S9MX26_9FLAO|nr:amidohydrolase [Nonlabens ponticola]AZQ43689.1 amidohydrolase [Nonlabens ponticola]